MVFRSTPSFTALRINLVIFFYCCSFHMITKCTDGIPKHKERYNSFCGNDSHDDGDDRDHTQFGNENPFEWEYFWCSCEIEPSLGV